MKCCEQVLRALSPELSQGCTLSGELQERKWSKVTGVCSPMMPSSRNHCALCLTASPSILLFQAALLLDIKVLPLQVSRGARNGTGESQTLFLVSMKNK